LVAAEKATDGESDAAAHGNAADESDAGFLEFVDETVEPVLLAEESVRVGIVANHRLLRYGPNVSACWVCEVVIRGDERCGDEMMR
jgi:hypothetical protein